LKPLCFAAASDFFMRDTHRYIADKNKGEIKNETPFCLHCSFLPALLMRPDSRKTSGTDEQ
jgi:hypothetical protein